MDKVWWKRARLAAAAMKDGVKRKRFMKDKVTLFAYAHPKSAYVNETQYCHAGLSSVDRGCIAIVNSVQTYHDGYLTLQEKELFMHWLANESPFKQVFVSKSAKQVLKQGYAFMQTDVPGALLGAACVAMRFLWEKSHLTVAWVDLVNGGMDKSLAFYLCHWISQSGSRTGRAELMNYNGNHVVFDQMSMQGVGNFIKGKHAKSDTYKETSRYRGYGRSLYDHGGKSGGQLFMNLVLGMYNPTKGGAKKPVNPFKKVERGSVYYQECINELLRLKDVLLEEAINA